MNRWVDTGVLAVLVVAATQISEATVMAVLTLVIVPLAGVAWREREKRLKAENECDRLRDKIEEGKEASTGLHEEVRSLREEVRDITGRSRSLDADLFPSRARRPISPKRRYSRSTSPSPDSGRGSGGGSASDPRSGT